MKNAIIFHGTGCNPDSYWQPYLKRELEKVGFEVSIPALPNPNRPDIAEWLPIALKENYSAETVLVGHSAGCPLVLSVLENLKNPVKQAILVAGYARLKDPKYPEKILQDQYDWDKIRKNVDEIIFINSDNDPWGCDDVEGRYMFDQLGGTQIILHGEGHMGSTKYNQSYEEFPLLVKLIA